MTAPQTDATTDPQSIIAALQQRLDAALAREATLAEELAARDAALAAAQQRVRRADRASGRDHRRAEGDVGLAGRSTTGVRSDRSPGGELCNGPTAACTNTMANWSICRSRTSVAMTVVGYSAAAYTPLNPMRPARLDLVAARFWTGGSSTSATRPDRNGRLRDAGIWGPSQVAVPLIRDDMAIGVIALVAQAPGGFTDSQVELLKTFAEQAVIAIQSAKRIGRPSMC